MFCERKKRERVVRSRKKRVFVYAFFGRKVCKRGTGRAIDRCGGGGGRRAGLAVATPAGVGR